MAKKRKAPARPTQSRTTIARRKKTPSPGPGHDTLCQVLRGVYDGNIAIAGDSSNKATERIEAQVRAKRAVADAKRWGCIWPERI